MVQVDMFPREPEHGASRREDPSTAKAAAATVDAKGLVGVILKALRACPDGMTSEELADDTKRSLVSISPRLRPMQERGLIVDSGKTRPNRSGREATIWKLAPAPQ